ncbi:restriction endonuclease subunit S [Hymenobacter volaticus]|uniref:Restriction endonuclease subunit S n=1 Tax=Hymenobacter volaticus TaxID=2932254 RepID=A0ABY4G4C2_9BACT|nr:restriction endonuclease subunit S [Hymenobacter volaticus]UOQ65713.1 restriction endonuclease subunit S [Hymenobacter volaticus]
MKSNFKRLGDYIEPVDEFNTGWKIELLLGISNNKHFQKSQTNTIGVDLSKYRVVRTNQFAFNRATTRNGEKISISLRNGPDCIVSPSYRIFRSKDENELNSEYLMMWFRRPEFDRYARFRSHGSAHEFFDIDEMYEVRLPIPTIEEQRRIVAEYHTIQNRITLNNQLIQTLETTAQAIYKQWFVEFEFPNEAGQPYKSSGGEMVESELGEIPKGWRLGSIGAVLETKGYIRGPFGSALKVEDMRPSGIPVYEQQHAIDGHRNFRYYVDSDKFSQLKRFAVKPNDLVISCSGTLGRITRINEADKVGIINQALLILRVDPSKCSLSIFELFLRSKKGNDLLIAESGGSAQVNIAKREDIVKKPFLIAAAREQKMLATVLDKTSTHSDSLKREIIALQKAKNLLLSKLATIETALAAPKPAATKPAQLTLSFS